MRDSDAPRACFYVFWIDETQEPGMLCDRADDKGIDTRCLRMGKRIEDWPAYPTFYVDYDHADDYVLLWPHWTVFSDRVRLVVESCGIRGVQFLPVCVCSKHSPDRDQLTLPGLEGHTAQDIGQYWVLNVIQEADALDWERTRWHYPERKHECHPLLNIAKPALRWDALQGIDIFRLNVAGEHDMEPFISQRLKECLETAGATRGMTFLRFGAF